MVESEEAELTMVVVHAKNQPDGFYIALVPKSLDAAAVDSSLRELGIEGEQVFELGGWRIQFDEPLRSLRAVPDERLCTAEVMGGVNADDFPLADGWWQCSFRYGCITWEVSRQWRRTQPPQLRRLGLRSR